MKRFGAGVAAFLAAVAIIAGCGNASAPSPLHQTAVFVDGINNGDARAMCEVSDLHGHTLASCEVGWLIRLGQAAMYGNQFGGYKVVPHSTREWTQTYNGKPVQLATVQFVYVPSGGQKLTAHLVLHNGRWLIWNVT